MGGSLSCGGCQYGNCLNASSLLPGPSSYRFAAEIFRLSDDRSEWLKVHPNVLSVTVNRKIGNCDTIAELSAANLRQQNVLQMPIHRDSEIKRYSERFVYWKAENGTFALNVVSKNDIDHFCAVASTSGMAANSSEPSQTTFRCEMAPLMNARHGHIIETEALRFSNCTVVFRSPDAIQIFDKDNHQLLATSAFEILLSANEPNRILFLSFPSKAIALKFSQPSDLRDFCQLILNESSIELAGGIRSHEYTITWFNRILDSVVALIRGTRYNTMTTSTSSSGIDLSADPRLPGNAVAASKHYMETLYSLKYMLIVRIAALKGFMPNSNFSEMIYPTELRARVSSTHLANYVHLYCCLHAQFSIRKQLKEIFDSSQFLRAIESPAKPQPISLSPEPKQDVPKDVENRRIVDEKLLKSIIELVQTEEAFVKDLEKLMCQYVVPAQLSFLDCTDKLIKTHSIFLNSLQDASGDLLTASSSQSLEYAQIKDAVMRISALFINKCNKFKIYSEYSAAYLRFQHLQKTDEKLKNKLAELNDSGEHRESVQSLLIKPIQRVLKYPLFLEQIKDFCTKDSMEQKQCVQALNRMQTLATYVNEMQRIHEEYGLELQRLAKLPELEEKNLWMDLRDLFMFAHLKWILPGEKKYTDCVAFVFMSLVLVLGPQPVGKKKQQRIHKIFPIAEIDANELDSEVTSLASSSSDSNQHFFTITHIAPSSQKEITYPISCCHSDIKSHFVKSVKKALRVYLKQKPRPISGSSQSDWGYSSCT